MVSAVLNGMAFSKNFVVMQSLYFSMNIIGLVVVLMLNRNHVKKASLTHSKSDKVKIQLFICMYLPYIIFFADTIPFAAAAAARRDILYGALRV